MISPWLFKIFLDSLNTLGDGIEGMMVQDMNVDLFVYAEDVVGCRFQCFSANCYDAVRRTALKPNAWRINIDAVDKGNRKLHK